MGTPTPSGLYWNFNTSAIATGFSRHLESQGHASDAVLTDGYRLAFLIGAVLVGLGTVVAAVALDKSGPRPTGTPTEVHLAEEELSAASEPFPH